VSATDIKFKDMAKKLGNKIRYKGVLRLYHNGTLQHETPYSLLDAFDTTPAITIDELELMTTQDIEARAAAMIEYAIGGCMNFELINNVIYMSDDCSDEEDEFMIGQIIDYAGVENTWDTEKWLNCDGAILNIDAYPELYAIIGREWTHDSIVETKFQLPNLAGRVTLGINKSGPVTPRDISAQSDFTLNYGRVGNLGGFAGINLTKTQNALHSHELKIYNVDAEHSDSGHKYYPAQYIQKNTPSSGTVDKQWTGETQDAGSGSQHENRQPYAVVFKLIRYK
jgi:microcystin-dependent protein